MGQEFTGIIFIYLLIKISLFFKSLKKSFFQMNPTYLGGFICSWINYTKHSEKYSINWFGLKFLPPGCQLAFPGSVHSVSNLLSLSLLCFSRGDTSATSTPVLAGRDISKWLWVFHLDLSKSSHSTLDSLFLGIAGKIDCILLWNSFILCTPRAFQMAKLSNPTPHHA